MKIAKGSLVTLDPEVCFTSGSREYPLIHWDQDEERWVEGFRHLTSKESQNLNVNQFDDSFDIPLPPMWVDVRVESSQIMEVLKAKVRTSKEGKFSGGWCMVRFLEKPQHPSFYIKRSLLKIKK